MLNFSHAIKQKRQFDIFFFISCLMQPVEQPEEMTQIIVEALEITGRRGIISKGWGGLGSC